MAKIELPDRQQPKGDVLWNYLTSFKRQAGTDHVWLKLALGAMRNVPGAQVAFFPKTCQEGKDKHAQGTADYPACFEEYKTMMKTMHFILGRKLSAPEVGSEVQEMTSAELDDVVDDFMYLLADADKDGKMSLLESYISGLFRSAPPLSQALPCPFSVLRLLSACHGDFALDLHLPF